MRYTVLAAFAGLTLAACGFAADPLPPGQGPNPVVIIDTSMGPIKVELFQDKAPGTVKNFLQYADDKHYDGTVFHRIIKDFMIQGGGLDQKMSEKPTRPPIKNESYNNVSNARGTIAMARKPDPDSATCQFFINVVDNSRLDKANFSDKVGYCVFGRVIEGMDVADKIRAVPTGTNNVPATQVLIKSVRRTDKK
jgi:cyclophilin family peptidyl-prolyl cis-trans isomerase